MKKIISYALVTVFYCQSLFASVDIAPDDRNQLSSVLSAFMSKNVDIQMTDESDDVVLKGPRDQIEAALALLGDYDFVRRILLPVDLGGATTQESQTPLTSWDVFLSAIEFNSEDSLFNITSPLIEDAEGVLTVSTPKRKNKRDVDNYLEDLTEESTFFKWALDNIDSFVESNTVETKIHYDLLETFLFMPVGEFDIVNEDDDIVEYVLSKQNTLKRFVAASCGHITLEPNAEGGYTVRTISLGDGATKSLAFELLLDNSSSMQGTYINIVNKALPTFFDQVQKALPVGGNATVDIYTFNDKKEFIGTYEIFQGESLPLTPTLSTHGMTDLTLIKSSLAKDQKLIVMTDGSHTTSNDLKECFDVLRTAMASGQSVAQPRFFKVGQHRSDFF